MALGVEGRQQIPETRFEGGGWKQKLPQIVILAEEGAFNLIARVVIKRPDDSHITIKLQHSILGVCYDHVSIIHISNLIFLLEHRAIAKLK